MLTYFKNIGLILVFLFVISCIASCGGKGADTPQEDKLVFTITPDPGSTIFAALSSSQNISINITSTLPPSGVVTTISVTQETNNAIVFNQSLNSTTANFAASIQNLAPGVVCNAIITVTSKSTATNSASKTFKIARK